MISQIIKLAEEVPETEFFFDFVQAMANAMSVSFFKYGAAPIAYPHKVDALKSLKERLRLYEEGGIVRGEEVKPGNPAYLVDVGNFAGLEYRYPRHPGRTEFANQHTDSDRNSPGRIRLDNATPDATNDGLSQRDRAAQPIHDAKLQGAQVYKRSGG